ncbi:MAG: hypothetical protein SNJ57_16225 [Cyanobacteriota bacterium]
MKWIIRHGIHYWLQSSVLFTIEWGDRSTARLFSTKEQAQAVVDALLKTGRYHGVHLHIDELRPEFVNISPDLLLMLRRCAEMLAKNLPQDSFLRDFWAHASLQAVNYTENHLTDFQYMGSDAVSISGDLLEDLQECASQLNKFLAPPKGFAKNDPEPQDAVVDFARKTLELMSEIQGVQSDAT